MATGEPRLVAAAESPASSLRAQATRLFRAKRFAAACPKFQAAVQLSPNDPELLLDLAVCDERIKALDAARKLNEQVIQIESVPSRLLDTKAARNRRHAYYNLAQEGAGAVGAGKNGEVVCFPLEQKGGCTKSLFACAVGREDGWAARLLSTRVIRIAAEKDAATLDPTASAEPDFSGPREKSDPLPIKIKRGDAVTYLENWEEEPRSDWEGTRGSYGCALVHFDACAGLLGLVCKGREDSDEELRTRVEEYVFE